MLTKDRALILTSISCLLALSGNAFLVHSRDHFIALSKGNDNLLGTSLYYFHIMILVILTTVGLVWIFNRGRGRFFGKLNWKIIPLQDPISLNAVLLGLFISQFGFLLNSSRLRATALFLSGFFLVLSYLWLFYRREQPSFPQIIRTTTFVVLVIYIRITLLQMIGIPEDPYWLITTRILFAAILVLIGSLPGLAIYFHLRKQTYYGFFKARKKPIGLIIFLLLLSVILILLNQIDGGVGTPIWVALRFGGLLGIFLAGNSALVIVSAEDHLHTFKFRELNQRQYNTVMLLIAAVYILATIIHSNNVPIRINPDGLSYLTIAQKLSAGNFVVRGLWAPLLPVLIAPLLSIGIIPTTAWQIVAVVTGLLWAFSLVILAGRFQLSNFSKAAIFLSITFLSFRITSKLIVPDVLSAAVLTWYFYVLTEKQFIEKPISRGIMVGLLGGLAYYARHYNLPFVLAHLLVTGVILILQDRNRKSTLSAIFTGLITLLLVVSPWIAALSLRYGQFTYSTGLSINRSVIGPDGVADVYRPCSGQQTCKIPDDVLFPWEDPPLEYFPSSDWNPLSDADSFLLQFQLITEGLSKWLHFLTSSFGTFPLLGLLLFLVLTFIYWSDRRRRFLFSWVIITSLLYAIGYISFGGGESRYHIPYIPLLLMAVFFLLDKSLPHLGILFKKSNKISTSIVSIFILGIPMMSLVKIPEIIQELQKPQIERCEKQALTEHLDHLIPPMVGSDASINKLAFQTGVQTYGVLLPDTDPSEADQRLRELTAKTFIAISGTDLAISLIDEYGYPLVVVEKSCGVTYSVLRVPSN